MIFQLTILVLFFSAIHCSVETNGTIGIGEFCKERLQNPKHTKLSEFDKYYKHMKKKGGLSREFNSIPLGMVYPRTVGAQPENSNQNRYQITLPYDHSRVILNSSDNRSDYVNANYMPNVTGHIRYIATQGPIRNSTAGFWRMIWEQNVRIIVMVARLVDLGFEEVYKYWPDDERKYDDYLVTMTKSDYNSHFVNRRFNIQFENETRTVMHYQFLGWPNYGVPKFPQELMNFVNHIKESPYYEMPNPIVVHCSAGQGRTGSYILLDAMLEAVKHSDQIDVTQQLCRQRMGRVNSIENIKQFRMVHEAIVLHLQGTT